MGKETFAGDKKVPLVSPLAGIEKRIIEGNVRKFPPWIEGYHLTWMTLAWSGGMLLFGFLAARGGPHSLHWLWGSSLMLFLQWFTDSFDGALGRLRDFGIPKWGFHVDHFLDFLFMWCVCVGYVFLILDNMNSVLLLFAVAFLYAMCEVNSFLSFAATNQFKITYLGVGPTELRVLCILLNTALILRGPAMLHTGLPYALAVSAVLVLVIFYRTQKMIWAIDMEDKRKRTEGEG